MGSAAGHMADREDVATQRAPHRKTDTRRAGYQAGGEGIIEASMNEQRWRVFYTGIRAELAAGAAIADLGFQTFIPTEKRILRAPNRKPRLCVTALFPRYGFVRFSANDEWGPILTADGVQDILRSNNIPLAVNDSCIDGLKLADEIGVFDKTKPPKAGMMVEVTQGPFASLMGKVLRARTGDRVDVLLKFLGADVPATIHLGALREMECQISGTSR